VEPLRRRDLGPAAVGGLKQVTGLEVDPGLVARHCSLVIGVGQSSVDAVELAAKANPHKNFAVVGGRDTGNVTVIAATAARSSIDMLIRKLAK
jgi:hypothetical protein